MVVEFALAAAWLVAWRAPETRIGTCAFRATVVWPARLLSAITRGQVLATCLLGVSIGMVAWFGGGDGLAAVAMGAPDLLVWLSLVDAATLAEVALVAIAAATSLRVRKGLGWRPMVRPRATRRAKRARPVLRAPGRAANDDEDRRAFAA